MAGLAPFGPAYQDKRGRRPVDDWPDGRGFEGLAGFRMTAQRLSPRVGALALIALVAVGCTGAGPSGEMLAAASPPSLAEVFAAGYQAIAERYVDPIGLRRLAVAGMRGLPRLAPGSGIDVRDAEIDFIAADQRRIPVSLPNSDEARDWADATAQLIAGARASAPEMAAEPDSRIVAAVFDSALGELDGFSRYVEPAAAGNGRAQRLGFGGVGLRLGDKEGRVQIVEVLPGTPAANAGLRVGDTLTHVDGTPVSGLTPDILTERLRGPVGSQVALIVERGSAAIAVRTTIERGLIVAPTVFLRREGDVAVIRVTSFNAHTARGLIDMLGRLRADGEHPVFGIVLDLRDNPGGLLDQSIVVADAFLNGGTIVSTHGRHRGATQYFAADSADPSEGLPVVVLANGGSASAAEIVAAALQENGRAVVIGADSYGKGSVQNVIRLPNDGEIIVTWAELLTPAGHPLNKIGVHPDLCVGAIFESEGASGGGESGPALLSAAALLAARYKPAANAPATLNSRNEPCPTRQDSSGRDEAAAEMLIRNPALYAAFRRPAPPQLAAAPTGDNGAIP